MDESGQEADHSTAIHVGAGGRVGDIAVQGDVVGRDKITISEDLTYDVSDLGHNPYLGLASYTYATRAFYGGREPQIRDAVARLTAPGDEPVVLFVTGASGSGKSSFAQAGLIPALEEAYAAHGQAVRWSVLRPGRYPIEALGRALRDFGVPEPHDQDWRTVLRTPEDLNHLLATETPTKQVNVLVFDQFEELFTQAEPAERDATCALLSGLNSFKRLHTHVLATLRSDYLPALFDVPDLFERGKQEGIELRAMSSDELARAIRRPLQEQARREGKDRRLDPALVDRLVEDVGGNPALLPLLQVTLRALWDEPPHKLVLVRYRSLTHALDQHANQLLEQDLQGRDRPALEREQLMRIFLDLVQVSLDDDPRRDVRRTVPKEELVQGRSNRLASIDELIEARLLSTSLGLQGESVVEVVDLIHESLLHNWARLRSAVQEQRQLLQRRERFYLALHEWTLHERADTYLLQGVRLAEAQALADQHDIALGGQDARQLVAGSIARQDHARRKQQRLVRSVAAAIFILAVVASIAAVGFYRQSEEASRQRDIALTQQQIALSRELAASATSQLSIDPELGMLLAVRAVEHASTAQAGEALRRAVLGFDMRASLRGHRGSVLSAAFSPDARRVLTTSDDGTARLWNAGTGQQMLVIGEHQHDVQSAVFSPDGERVLTASQDRTAGLWDTSTGQQLAELRGHVASVWTAAFSADGQQVVTASDDGTARLWDARTGQQTRVLRGTAPLRSGAFSPDGQRVLTRTHDHARIHQLVQVWDVNTGELLAEMTGDASTFSPDGQRVVTTATYEGIARVWDASTGRELLQLRAHRGGVLAATFSPDGRLIVTAGVDGTVHVWSASSGQSLAELRHVNIVSSAVFSSDGRRIVTASGDRTARVWDVSSGQEVAQFRGHTAAVLSAVFSPNGRLVVTAGEDGLARIWNATGVEPAELRGHTGQVSTALFSPDGRRVVTASVDQTARIWDPTDGHELTQLRGHSGNVLTAVFSPDGRRVATASEDGTARVWDASTGQSLTELRANAGRVLQATFSPDGQWVMTVSSKSDGTGSAVQVWDADRGQVQAEMRGDIVRSAAFSSDGQRIVTASGDGSAQISDARTGRPLVEMRHQSTDQVWDPSGRMIGAAFSGDGTRVATANEDGVARVWDANTGRQLAEVRGYPAEAGFVAFSSDGWRALVSNPRQVGVVISSDPLPLDWTARLLDAVIGQQVATLRGHSDRVTSGGFSPDGQWLVTASQDGTAQVWEAATGGLVAPLRGHAAPVLTAAFSPDGKQVVTAGEDGIARVYACMTCRPIDELVAWARGHVDRGLTREEESQYLHE